MRITAMGFVAGDPRRRAESRATWPRSARLGVALLCAASAACGQSAPRSPSTRAITSIEIIVVPPGGGQAQATFLPGGLVRGGHLSGDSPPMVYQDEKRLDSTTVKAIWAAARALGDTLLAANVLPDSTFQGYVMLQVTFGEGRQAILAWPFRSEHADTRVRALAALLMENRTGGW